MKYAVLLYAGADLDAGPGAPEWEASLPTHQALAERLSERGYAFTGAPLHASSSATSVRVRDGQRLVTDGPFAETKEQLWGYYEVEAPDLDAMIDVVADLWEAEHGTVEIRPVVARDVRDLELAEDAVQEALVAAPGARAADARRGRHRAPRVARRRRRGAGAAGRPARAAEIARAFITAESALAQRLVRAQRKIRDSGVPFAVPAADQMAERLAAVLGVIYLVFTEGYAATTGPDRVRVDLCDEAVRPGPYQVQAAIACLHASAPRAEATDWAQIAALYGTLMQMARRRSWSSTGRLQSAWRMAPTRGSR